MAFSIPESTSGALRMTFRPGDMTIVDVETTLFPRVNIDHVGLGGIGSTYFYGPNDRSNTDDLRPSVYEFSGLQMLNGKGEWLWRPLQNPDTLQISAFVDQAPKGFGLLQRDRSFEVFQDDEQRFDRRPSLWIEPLGEWDQGSVQLLEIPTDAEINDNILAYWRPKAQLAAGSEVPFAYRQYWCWSPPERPPLATVSATRVGSWIRWASAPFCRRVHRRRRWAKIRRRTSSPFSRSGPAPFTTSGNGSIRSERRYASDSNLTRATKTRVR